MNRVRTHSLSGVGTDCTGSLKSNYHMTRTTMPPPLPPHKKNIYTGTIYETFVNLKKTKK
jgi:hypothetical protein